LLQGIHNENDLGGKKMLEVLIFLIWLIPGFIGFYITSKEEEKEERRKANRKRWRQIMKEGGFYIWEK